MLNEKDLFKKQDFFISDVNLQFSFTAVDEIVQYTSLVRLYQSRSVRIRKGTKGVILHVNCPFRVCINKHQLNEEWTNEFSMVKHFSLIFFL